MSSPLKSLSRRHFLGITASGLVTLANRRWPNLSQTRGDALTKTVHLHTFAPDTIATADAVKAAMLSATDLSWLQQGDSVFVKVASNSNYAPPSVTSPAVLEGVVRVLKEAGAGTVYVGDMSGAQFVRHLPTETIGSTRDNMRTNGLLAAAEAAGATVHCFEEVPFEQAYIPGIPPGEHHWGDDLRVAEILDRVDHIVNLPRLGKHVLAGASLGLKNAVGWMSDHSRMVLHRDAATFHEKIAEANAIPQLANKMRLTLTLADQALTTYGPDAGYRFPLHQPLIIASEDVVSHDQVALLALLWAREQTPKTALAEDPYPAQSNSLNWWFVRVTWDNEIAGYQDLPTFDDVAATDALTHINLAFDLLHGGRPDRIDVVPGGLPLDETLASALTMNADLRISIRQKTL